MTSAIEIARDNGLATDYLDPVSPRGNCPGFNLYVCDVEGTLQLIAADYPGSAELRVAFRFGGEVRSIELLGPNPDKITWLSARH